MINDLTGLALEKAQAILGQECSPTGLRASPEGYPHQAWSAGMCILAFRCVAEEKVMLL